MECHRIADQWVQNPLTADWWFEWKLRAIKDDQNRDTIQYSSASGGRPPVHIGDWCFFIARADLEEQWPNETGKEPSILLQAIMCELKTLQSTPEGRALTRKLQATKIRTKLGRNVSDRYVKQAAKLLREQEQKPGPR